MLLLLPGFSGYLPTYYLPFTDPCGNQLGHFLLLLRTLLYDCLPLTISHNRIRNPVPQAQSHRGHCEGCIYTFATACQHICSGPNRKKISSNSGQSILLLPAARIFCIADTFQDRSQATPRASVYKLHTQQQTQRQRSSNQHGRASTWTVLYLHQCSDTADKGIL